MKKVEQETVETLIASIDLLLKKISELDEKLNKNLKDIKKYEILIACSYYLSSIYSCYEDIFTKIAKTFENRIENPASWHKELLERMRLHIDKIRPEVISEKSYVIFDELRRFRHAFKSSYVFTLYENKFKELAATWNSNSKLLMNEIKKFIKKIR